jgi:hypothetical protein
MDNGANGGMAGNDVKIIAYHDHDRAQVTGIAGNSLEDLPIVTAAGFIESNEGPVIGIFHQYAYYGKSKTIHSVPQIEHFDIKVDCTSRKKSGKQRVLTPDGWIIPLNVRNGLTYMDMRPPTDSELNEYPHVVFTSDIKWDPTVLDNETDLTVTNDNLIIQDFDAQVHDSYSSDTGENTQRIIAEMLMDRCPKSTTDRGKEPEDNEYYLSVLEHKDTLNIYDERDVTHNVGDAPTRRIRTEEILKIAYRSAVRPMDSKDNPYGRLEPFRGVKIKEYIVPTGMGRTSPKQRSNEDGERYHATQEPLLKLLCEFGIIENRPFYGLKTREASWHDGLANTLRGESFVPCKEDYDVWMRKTNVMFEYMNVYGDVFAMVMKNPAAFCELLNKKHGYKKSKGDIDFKYHLGCDFERDPDMTFHYSEIVDKKFGDWTGNYGNILEELLPLEPFKIMGKSVITTTYENAILYDDYLTGRSVTGVLHLVNQKPTDWYRKKQATVETATYGLGFNAASTAMEKIINNLQMNMQHNALAYHRVREAIAAGLMKFLKIDGKTNPSDILSKHCGHPEAEPHVETLLFWRDNTSEIPDKGE